MDDHLELRQLKAADIDKGFLKCLAQLTKAPDVHPQTFADTRSQCIVGTASILIERKFIRGCSKAGHIEDVVVDSNFRGHHLGQRLIDEAIRIANSNGCYKVILDCARGNVEFYSKCGLEEKGVEMARYMTE